MNFFRFENDYVVIDKIVSISSGQWSDSEQDYLAVIILEGEIRIELKRHFQKEVVNILKEIESGSIQCA